MKIVGRRRPRVPQATPSGALLEESARILEGVERYPQFASTFIPKGVYRFRTLAEADEHRMRCLVEGMRKLARARR
jgi:hypothetical protein